MNYCVLYKNTMKDRENNFKNVALLFYNVIMKIDREFSVLICYDRTCQVTSLYMIRFLSRQSKDDEMCSFTKTILNSQSLNIINFKKP